MNDIDNQNGKRMSIEEFLDNDERKDLLRFLTAGSVDDGKSTLIGRLLFDSKKIYEDQLDALERDSKRMGNAGDHIDYALLLDGLKAGDKVIVEGLNMVTKHVKPRRQGEQGGIVKAEGAIYACKVMPVCPKCGKATRVGHSVKDGKTVRVCRKCGAEL